MSDAVNNDDKNKKNVIKQFALGKSIGEGTFGKVKLGTHILTGEKVAVKILEKAKIREVADVERVAREIHILKLLRHPNIIQLQEIIEDNEKLYLFIEQAAGGELFDYIVKHQRLKEKEACKYFQQIINGVEYIHRLRIVHRDLKPENLLLDDKLNIKIVDFGLSNTYKQGEMLKTACGSPCQAAPEMVAGKSQHGVNVDLWSCGVILFAMICGQLPFEDPNTSALYKKILAGEYNCPKQISNEARDLLKCVLNTDPVKRQSIEDIRKHGWQQHVVDVRPEGVLMGQNCVPVDEEVFKCLEEYGFNPEQGRKCLESNKHNHITTTYQLTLAKRIKLGQKSPVDPQSDNQDRSLVATRPHSTVVNSIISKHGIDKLKQVPKPSRSQRDQRTENSDHNRTLENLPELHNPRTQKQDMKKLLTNGAVPTERLNHTMQPVGNNAYANYNNQSGGTGKQNNTVPASQLNTLTQVQPVVPGNNVHIQNNGAFVKSPFGAGTNNVKYTPAEYNKTQTNGFMSNRKGTTFRATTAGQNGRGATYKQPAVPQKLNNDHLNNTYNPSVKEKNILIQMINDKKSPRPPTNGQGMITRRYKNDLNKTKM